MKVLCVTCSPPARYELNLPEGVPAPLDYVCTVCRQRERKRTARLALIGGQARRLGHGERLGYGEAVLVVTAIM